MNFVAPDSAAGKIMHLSVREIRMIVERILLTTGLPDGFVPAVRDCVLYSQAMGLGGMATLKRDYEVLKRARPEAMQFVDGSDGRAELDAVNQHAWIVAPNLIDLALAAARTGRKGEIRVHNVAEISELALLPGFAGRFGARIELGLDEGCASIRVVADGLAEPDEVLRRALAQGLPVPKSLWEDLYAKSHEALTPDSIVSRRHAGPVMVDAHGRVHGRDDDDTDFALLGMTPANSVPENS